MIQTRCRSSQTKLSVMKGVRSIRFPSLIDPSSICLVQSSVWLNVDPKNYEAFQCPSNFSPSFFAVVSRIWFALRWSLNGHHSSSCFLFTEAVLAVATNWIPHLCLWEDFVKADLVLRYRNELSSLWLMHLSSFCLFIDKKSFWATAIANVHYKNGNSQYQKLHNLLNEYIF